jgi:YidC/Oxa1 family membrane protein insertase
MSPFSGLSGCLPLLVQLPVIYSLFNGIKDAVNALTAHGARPDLHFLWIADVSKSPASLSGASAAFPANLLIEFAHPAVLIIPLLAAAATFVQSRMMMQPPRAGMTAQEQSMANLSRQMSFLMPVIIFLMASGSAFSIGISLYWVTQSMYMVIQQYYMLGWGGMKVPAWMPGASRTTSLSHPEHVAGAAGGASTKTAPKAAVVASKPVPATVGGGDAPPRKPNANRSNKARKRRR